jgi:hypothetical protein
MGKSFIFIRGLDRPEKHELIQAIINRLNPDPSHVRAILLAIDDFVESDSKEDLKAADRTVKNRVRKVLLQGQERFIVIANESLSPPNWRPFAEMLLDVTRPDAEGKKEPPVLIGVNVVFPGKMLNTDEDVSSNLQKKNSGVFISEMTKYHEFKVGTNDPQVFAEEFVEALLEGETE